MSDIHGCYEKYIKMLDIINFSDNDTLFVLGDVIDRGDESFRVLKDMSMRTNVIPIMGNHEYAGYHVFKDILSLMVEITDESIEALAKANINVADIARTIEIWLNDYDSKSSLQEFRNLTADEREYLLEYIEEFSLYEIIKVKNKKYFLTHFGIPKGATLKNLDSYDGYDFIESTLNYNKEYFKDTIIITGHLPTFVIDESYRGRIYRRNNIINIDTGAAFGEHLACLCLETNEEFYT
jgi:serine/threonine protein phosphatase 1